MTIGQKESGKMKTMICFVAAFVLQASAVDYYADGVNGNDANDGLSAERAFKTLEKASLCLKAGDTLHLKAGCVFPESLVLRSDGTVEKPIRVKGNGAVISGLERVPDGSWIDKGANLWCSTNKMFWGACRPRVLDSSRKMISLEISNPAFGNPALLAPGEAVWNSEGIWFRCGQGRKPQECGLSGYFRVSGIVAVNRHNWIIEDLVAEHFTNDGVNLHGLCRGMFFVNIETRENGDDGFSIHEDVLACVQNLRTWGNDYGVSDVSWSQSVFSGVTAVSNRICGLDFHGGMRIVRGGKVFANAGNQISVTTSAVRKSSGNPNPMLRASVYLEDVHVEGGKGAALRVNSGNTVTAANCSFAGTDLGLHLMGGRVHLENCEVRDCAGVSDISPSCKFTSSKCKGL